MKKLRQRSWAGGAFAAEAPANVPSVGALDLENMLLDDEGSLRRRGGCTYITTPDNVTPGDDLPLSVWDGALVGGQRTVMYSPDGFYVVAADGVTLVNMLAVALVKPGLAAVLGGWLFMRGSGVTAQVVYAGSRKAASYSVGTVSTAAGSRVVTGVGTLWLANVDAGMMFKQSGNMYAVATVDSNTQITLVDPALVTVAGAAYAMQPVTAFGGIVSVPGLTAAQVTAAHVAVVAGRLVVAVDNIVAFSDGPHPNYGTLRWWSFPENNQHKLAAGADVRAAVALRDRLFVFTTAGVFVISNMQYEIVGTDGAPQHRVEHYSRDVIALEGGAGITTFGDSLIVPAADDIYLMDGLSRPEPISRSARRDWRSFVNLGYEAGNAALFRGHYVLPIINTAAAPDDPVETWLFRMDRPVETSQGVVFPWSRLTGQAGELGGVAVQEGAPRRLVGGGLAAGPARMRLLDVTPTFDVGATNSADANGTAVTGRIATRDFAGAGPRTAWRYLRARFRLSDAAGTETLDAEIATGGDSTSSWGALGNTASAREAAQVWWAWPFVRVAELLRFRLTATGGDEFVLHEIEVEYEEPGW